MTISGTFTFLKVIYKGFDNAMMSNLMFLRYFIEFITLLPKTQSVLLVTLGIN